jgi:hypothetical protein
MPEREAHGPNAGRRSSRGDREALKAGIETLTPTKHLELRHRLRQTAKAFSRLVAARNRHQAALARNDMRDWQIQRRKRTKQLIELGGLVVKAGVVDQVDDDRATIYGALLTIAEMLRGPERENALARWKRTGKLAFESRA